MRFLGRQKLVLSSKQTLTIEGFFSSFSIDLISKVNLQFIVLLLTVKKIFFELMHYKKAQLEFRGV
jgi:hypothetical protein